MNNKKDKSHNHPDDGARFVVELKKILYFCIFASVAIAVLYFVLK